MGGEKFDFQEDLVLSKIRLISDKEGEWINILTTNILII